MGKKILVFLFLTYIFPLRAFAETGMWEKVTSLDMYRVESLETVPNGIVLAGIIRTSSTSLSNGLFLSEDFGKTWKSIGLEKHGPEDVSTTKVNYTPLPIML